MYVCMYKYIFIIFNKLFLFYALIFFIVGFYFDIIFSASVTNLEYFQETNFISWKYSTSLVVNMLIHLFIYLSIFFIQFAVIFISSFVLKEMGVCYLFFTNW